MNQTQIWEHHIQTLETPRLPWPTFYNLGMAEDFARALRAKGVVVTAIISSPFMVTNSPGGDC